MKTKKEELINTIVHNLDNTDMLIQILNDILIDAIVYHLDDTDMLNQILNDLDDDVKDFVLQILKKRYLDYSNKFRLFNRYSLDQYPAKVSLLIILKRNEYRRLMDKYEGILFILLKLEKIEPIPFYYIEK